MTRTDTAIHQRSPLFWFAAGTSAYILLCPVLALSPWPHAPVFFSFVPGLAGWAAFGGCLVAALSRCRVRETRRMAVPAVCICLAALILRLTLPLHAWGVRLNFAVLETPRAEVVSLVRGGELGSLKESVVRLPQRYGHLSENGMVLVDVHRRIHVYFPMESYPLSGEFGFLYTSDDEPERTGVGQEFLSATPLAPHWWWVSFT